LVELAEIVEVVDVIAVAFGGGSLATWWKPDGVDANSLQFRDGANETLIVFVVGWDVPFEGLKEGVVFGRGFLF
jgi:hypothetical protein